MAVWWLVSGTVASAQSAPTPSTAPAINTQPFGDENGGFFGGSSGSSLGGSTGIQRPMMRSGGS